MRAASVDHDLIEAPEVSVRSSSGMGRQAGGGKWLVEGCRHIDARDWRRDGYLQPPAPGGLPYSITASCGGREQHITIVWTPCRFGGKRPWFQCGCCGRRVVRLYIVGGVFARRHCPG